MSAGSDGEQSDPKNAFSPRDLPPKTVLIQPSDEPKKKKPPSRPRTQKELMPESDNLSNSPPNEDIKQAVSPPAPSPFQSESEYQQQKEDQAKQENKDEPSKKQRKRSGNRLKESVQQLKSQARRRSTAPKQEDGQPEKSQPAIDANFKSVKKTSRRKSEADTETPKKSSIIEVPIQCNAQGIPVQSVHIVGSQFIIEHSSFRPYRIMTRAEWDQCKGVEGCEYIALLRKSSQSKAPETAVEAIPQKEQSEAKRKPRKKRSKDQQAQSGENTEEDKKVDAPNKKVSKKSSKPRSIRRRASKERSEEKQVASPKCADKKAPKKTRKSV